MTKKTKNVVYIVSFINQYDVHVPVSVKQTNKFIAEQQLFHTWFCLLSNRPNNQWLLNLKYILHLHTVHTQINSCLNYYCTSNRPISILAAIIKTLFGIYTFHPAYTVFRSQRGMFFWRPCLYYWWRCNLHWEMVEIDNVSGKRMDQLNRLQEKFSPPNHCNGFKKMWLCGELVWHILSAFDDDGQSAVSTLI